MCGKSLQSCPTLCDPVGPQGSSAHPIFQARIMKRIAISISSGSSWHRDQTHISYISCIGGGGSLSVALPGKKSSALQSVNVGPSLLSIVERAYRVRIWH